VLVEDLRQPVGEFRQIGQRHGAILDEGDRLPVALHRHHDVQPRLAHRGHLRLRFRVGEPDHRIGMAVVGQQLLEALQ